MFAARRALPLALGLLLLATRPTRGDEAALLQDLRDFFRTQDADRRQALVAHILADPAYDRGRVREWLHQADLFEALSPGRHEIQVTLPGGPTLPIVLRIPKDYDPRRPYPLMLALHGAGGTGDQIAGYAAHLLGSDVEQYIVAAPTGYEELIINHGYWPPRAEGPAILLKVRQTVHVDSDRVFVMGYSMGGHTSWTLAALHPDQFAAAMPLAGNFGMLLADKLWPEFIPNLQHVPLTCVWGAGDIYWADGRVGPDGGIAGHNRRFRDLAAKSDIPFKGIELPDAGHRDVVPPTDAWRAFLAHRRVQSPTSFSHAFRHIYQSNVFWVEGHRWAGDQWTDQKRTVKLRDGENPEKDEDLDEAAARMYRGLLGHVEGKIDGNTLDVRRQKVKEMTVWVHDGMIDWAQPVVLLANGRKDFEGKLEPDLYVCLSQAARTWDFDRLRWAGLRFKSGSKTKPVTAATAFPTLAELLAPASPEGEAPAKPERQPLRRRER